MENQENKIGLKDLENEMSCVGTSAKPIHKTLDFIINNLEEIDFKKELGLDDEHKVLRKSKIVVVIKKLLEKVESLDLGIRVKNFQVFVYNRAYWQTIEPVYFKMFLAKAAYSLGLEEDEAEYFKFKNDLFEQFKSTAHVSLQEESNKSILINFLNGTLEIYNSEVKFRDFDKDDFLTYQLNFEYDENAQMPLFQKFINEVLPDESLQNILSEYLGSIFIKKEVLQLEKILLLYGTGSNGKSVVFDVIESLLGKHNISSFGIKKLTTCPNTRSAIEGKLLNYSSEIDEIGDFNIFKQLASREPLQAKLMYKDVYTIDHYAKLMFNCNDLPTKNEITKGYFRRFLIIPFNVFIPEEKQDRNLATKIIKSELAAVFNWILKGMNRVLRNKGYSKSKASDKAIADFERNADSVKSFITEHEYQPSDKFKLLSEIYTGYRNFCMNDGHKPCSKTTFSKRLEHYGYTKKRLAQGITFNLKKI